MTDARTKPSVAVALIGVVATALLFPLSQRLAVPDVLLVAAPIAALVMAAAVGYGVLVLRALGAYRTLDRERWIWAAIAGIGVIGTIQLLLAELHAFRASTAVVVVIAGVFIVALHGRDLSADLKERPRGLGGKWLIALAPFGALVFVRALAPPSFYDALVYHLGLPMQFAARGGAVHSFHDHYTAMPLLAEMAASPALLLAGAEGVGFVYAFEWFLLAAGVVVLVRRTLPSGEGPAKMSRAGSAAAFVTMSMPLLVFLPSATKPDIVGGLFALGVLRALSRLSATSPDGPARTPLLLLGALFVGLGCATKTNFLLWAVPIGGVVGFLFVRRKIAPRIALLSVVLVILGGALPYVRNAIVFSNPFYPFAAKTFGGPSWIEKTTTILDGDAHRIRNIGDVFDLFALPWSLASSTDPTSNEVLGLTVFIGAAALLAVAFAAKGSSQVPRFPALQIWMVLGALTLPLWLFTHALPRYDPFLWLPLGIAGGVGLNAVSRVAFGKLVVVVALLASTVVFMWNLAADEILSRGPSPLILQRTSRSAFLAEVFETANAFSFLNDNARGGCIFIATGDPRIAHLEVPAVVSEVYTQPVIDELITASKSVDDVITGIRALGATHVLFAKSAPDRMKRRGWAQWNDDDRARFDALPSALGGSVYEDPSAAVYVLPGARPDGRCGGL